MSYFIFDGLIQPRRSFVIKGEEARHLLNSRRVSLGDAIQCQDSSNRRYLAIVERLGKHSLSLLPVKVQPVPPESDFRINLFQALIKEKALDMIVQKTTELGVNSICIFPACFSQKINSKADMEKKILRRRKIALEACKQSGRLKPPDISYLPGTEDVRRHLSDGMKKQVPGVCLTTFGETSNIKDLSFSAKEINVVVGPEGGWADQEAESLAARGVHLGPRILRSETAAVSMVGILQCLFGDLSLKPLA